MQLNNLYRQVIMDHYKNPRNKGLVDDKDYVSFHAKNPSCGDDVTIQTKVVDGKVKDCRHEGTGCSICCSSASVLTEIMIDKTVEDALKFSETYVNMLTNKEYDEDLDLEDAIAYSGVKDFPARVKCASIAWKAFEETLKKE